MAYLIVLFRAGGMVAMLPGFGEASIPARVKLAVAICLAMIVYPAVATQANAAAATQQSLLGLFILEVTFGFALGLLLRVFLFCLQTAGSIAAQSTSLAQILGMAGVEPLPALGHILTMAGMALAMTMGLHIAATSYTILSYEWLPIGEWPDASVVTEMAVAQIASGFRVAFALAAPFFILGLLYNLTLGVINRAMPQLMVAFVGAPFITAASLVVLAVAAPLIVSTWNEKFFAFMLTQEPW